MRHVHAIVWIDHREATVIGFSLDRQDTVKLQSERPRERLHRKEGAVGSGRVADDHEFFDQIAGELRDVNEILVVGPGTAKTALETYLRDRHRAVADRIVGVETVDHPSDGQLLAFAQTFFKRVDQLNPG
jgi:stalled ribosome rescue protein Dom34